MRILVFFVVALAVLENALAQTALASPGALKVQTEAWKILKSFTAKASKEVKAFQSDIQSRVSDYYNEYTRVKGRIETKLNPLGIKGRTVLSAISDDIDALIASLKTQFDSEILSSEIDLVLNSLKSQFIDSLPDEIEWLTDAVFKNKTAIKCWDNNKAAIKMLVENIFQETQKVVKADQTQLGSQVKALVKQMRDGVAKAESEIQSQCKSDQACILKYFQDNRLAFNDKLAAFREIAVSHISNLVEDVIDNVKYILEAEFEIYEDRKNLIKVCMAIS